MHQLETDPRRHSPLEPVSPRLKLGVAVFIITLTALLPRHIDWVYLLPTVVVLILWPLCRMPFYYAVARLILAEMLIVGLALLSLFNPSATPLIIAAIVKSNLCVLTMLLLTWTTPFVTILEELRRLRFPSIMLTTLALMYRYLPVLVEESRRMQRARTSRTFMTNKHIAWKSLSMIVGRLFTRSIERAERIYLAMCARGWK